MLVGQRSSALFVYFFVSWKAPYATKLAFALSVVLFFFWGVITTYSLMETFGFVFFGNANVVECAEKHRHAECLACDLYIGVCEL